jgi:hypothetical protein
MTGRSSPAIDGRWSKEDVGSGVRERPKREDLIQLATAHAWSGLTFRAQSDASRHVQTEEDRAKVRLFDSAADLEGRRRAKYEHAARRPWLPVEPDPPEPK